MIQVPLQRMSDDELVECLQKVSEPLLAELRKRGYRIRMDEPRDATALPVFVRVPHSRAVAGD